MSVRVCVDKGKRACRVFLRFFATSFPTLPESLPERRFSRRFLPSYSCSCSPGLFARSGGLWGYLAIALLLCGLAAWGGPEKEATAKTPQDTLVDVVALANPMNENAARVAVAYRQRVPHSRVREEIARIAAAGGWQVENLVISDGSPEPSDLKRFPKTTSAMFVFKNAPQVVQSAPVLWPYLHGFQGWNHVEIMFALPNLLPYRGIAQFESEALSARLLKGEGVYRYEAVIRDHRNPLPALTVAPETGRNASSSVPSSLQEKTSAKEVSGSAFWPWLLTIGGAVLVAFVGGYLWLARRFPDRASIRALRP